LVVDLYTAEVMESLAEFGKLPRPGWSNLKVVITSAFVRMYRRQEEGKAFVIGDWRFKSLEVQIAN